MVDEESEPEATSSRQSLTMRSNPVRQIAFNFVPLSQIRHSTLRNRRVYSEDNVLLDEVSREGAGSPEQRADMIVKEMEKIQHIMQDDPQAEEKRREALRDLPQGLTMKRSVRAKLSASVSLRSRRRPLPLRKRLQYQLSIGWKKSRDRLRDFLFSIEPWYQSIRDIDGNFGAAVGTYFRFLRWLFAANFTLAVLSVCLVVVPQAMFDGGNRTVVHGMDLLTGKGGLEDTVLFYGHYHSGDVSSLRLVYNMPFAYFFTMLSLYGITFAVLCYRTAYSYRRNYIGADGVKHALAHKVFCGWDFGIVSQHAAELHATSIYNEFKEILHEQNKIPVTYTFLLKLYQCLANAVVMSLVLACIVALQYGLWLLLSLETEIVHWELCVSSVITVVLTVLPVMFSFVVRLEYYAPRTALYVTLARTWLLDIGTMILLLYYWTNSERNCWESHLGQEGHRLLVLDALVSLLLLPALDCLRALIYRLNPSTNPPEFNLAYNSLTIIHNQAVLWFGMAFSPLLPAVAALKLLLLFYVKKECAVRACQPTRKVWRAAQTETMLYMLVSLSLFAALLGLGTLFLGKSSHSCGPFTSYDRVYSVITDGVLRLSERPTLSRVLAAVTKPGVIALLALILGLSAWYMRARAAAQRSMVGILRHMLRLQARDKDFLLTAIAKVSNGEWMYSPKPEEEAGPDSHTWKYLQEVRKPSNADFHFDASRLSHCYKENRPNSYHAEVPKSNEDGETDSSFSWQGSNNCLNESNPKERVKKET